MNFKILLISLILLPCFSVFAQDPEAKKILDKFSEKTKSYAAYSADFEIKSENHQNGESNENTGKILVKGNKYRLDINKTQVYYDGKDIYNYIPQSNEVSISKPSKKKDDSFLKDPSQLFNLYTKDYKFRLLGETTINSRNCYEIDLYPIEMHKNYSIIKLLIDKEKLELVSAKVVMKSGVHYLLTVRNFNNQAQATDKDFSFNISAYKGIEVIDLR